jgi:1,4-alpha-glucan branching enzyme
VKARNRRLVIEWQNVQGTAQGKMPDPAKDSKSRNSRLVIEWQKPQQAVSEKAPRDGAGSQPGQPQRAVAVEFKFESSSAKDVQLAGAFIVHGGRRRMKHQSEGVWALNLRLLPGINYRYWFVVDGDKTLDPKNPKTDRNASVLSLP